MSPIVPAPETLHEIFEDARRLGLLGGPTPIEEHLAHARAFATTVAAHAPAEGPALDLGSGPGLPGLVLAALEPQRRWLLLDGSSRRCAFARDAVERLGVRNVEVLEGPAESLGRAEALRHHMSVVVARSFGPPALVAELGAPFLIPGGLLVVSEPPERPERWSADGLAVVGLADEGLVEAAGYGFRLLRAASPCADRYPRRIPALRRSPLW